MGNGNAPTLQSMCFCEENCRQTYTDWTAVSPETTETGVADLFYTVLFNGVGQLDFSVHATSPFMEVTQYSCPACAG
jgi:hypothetical protein